MRTGLKMRTNMSYQAAFLWSRQGYRDLQILLLDSVDSAALSRDSKIGSHWYWAEPGFADNSDINKTIEQPLQELRR